MSAVRTALMSLLVIALGVTATPARSVSLFGGNGGQSLDQFLPVDQAFRFNSRMVDNSLGLDWQVTDGYYLYRGRIKVTSADPAVQIGTPQFSIPGTKEDDPYFGKVTVFFEDVSAQVPVQLPPGKSEAELTVTYQGCAKAGLCYPPQHKKVLFQAAVGMSGATTKPSTPAVAPAAAPASEETASGLAQVLAQQSLGAVLVIFFLLGVGLTFTPCVLPMLPIVSTLVGAQRSGGSATSFSWP